MAGSDYLTQKNKSGSNPSEELLNLLNLFSDPKFRPFVSSLLSDGILTRQQLKEYFDQISIMSYLNKKNLYSWKERTQIFNDLIPLIKNDTIKSNLPITQTQVSLIYPDENELIINFQKKESHSFQYPTHVIINGKNIQLKNWRHLLLLICEFMIKLYPDSMYSLVYTPLFPNTSRLYFQRNKFTTVASSELTNGTWVDTNQSATEIINTVKGIIEYCKHPLSDVTVYYKKSSSASSRKKQRTASKIKSPSNKLILNYSDSINQNTHSVAESSQHFNISDDQVEKFLISRGLLAASLDEIISGINAPSHTRSFARKAIDSNQRIVEIAKGKFVHRNCIVDLDEAARIIFKILERQFILFDGYSNIFLLNDASRIDLSMFMNDNDFVGETEIYFLAKHLFSKEIFSGHQFVFYSNTHIWEKEPDYDKSAKGLLVNLARSNGGFISEYECQSFFDKIKYGKDMYLQGKLTNDHTFLTYARGEYLLSESLSIDQAWNDKFKLALDQLFTYNSYIIPRDISEAWFLMLPTLPGGLQWTLYLLQEVLIFNDFLYKPIFGRKDKNAIASAIVRSNSGLDSFSDVIILHLRKNIELPKKMDKEELRLLLCDFGMIEGDELKHTLYKALNGRNFAWSNENKNVYIVDVQ